MPRSRQAGRAEGASPGARRPGGCAPRPSASAKQRSVKTRLQRGVELLHRLRFRRRLRLCGLVRVCNRTRLEPTLRPPAPRGSARVHARASTRCALRAGFLTARHVPCEGFPASACARKRTVRAGHLEPSTTAASTTERGSGNDDGEHDEEGHDAGGHDDRPSPLQRCPVLGAVQASLRRLRGLDRACAPGSRPSVGDGTRMGSGLGCCSFAETRAPRANTRDKVRRESAASPRRGSERRKARAGRARRRRRASSAPWSARSRGRRARASPGGLARAPRGATRRDRYRARPRRRSSRRRPGRPRGGSMLARNAPGPPATVTA
jgi:hypothetical protein